MADSLKDDDDAMRTLMQAAGASPRAAAQAQIDRHREQARQSAFDRMKVT